MTELFRKTLENMNKLLKRIEKADKVADVSSEIVELSNAFSPLELATLLVAYKEKYENVVELSHELATCDEFCLKENDIVIQKMNDKLESIRKILDGDNGNTNL